MLLVIDCDDPAATAQICIVQTCATSVSKIVNSAGSKILSQQRLFLRFSTKQPVFKQSQKSQSALLTLPADLVNNIISKFADDTKTLMSVLLVSSELNTLVFQHVQNTLQHISWASKITMNRCLATELALCAVHFMTCSKQHGFSPNREYRPIKYAILSKHNRFGIVNKLEIIQEDRHVMQLEWERILEESGSVFPGGRSKGVKTVCPSDPSVQICCILGKISLIVDGKPVLVVNHTSPFTSAVACWMQNGQISIIYRRNLSISHNFSSLQNQ